MRSLIFAQACDATYIYQAQSSLNLASNTSVLQTPVLYVLLSFMESLKV